MASKTDKMNPMFKAEDRSTASERRDRQVFAELEKARIDSDAKTVRLKALRLEKEAADAAQALLDPPPAPPKKTRAKAKAS